MLTESKEEKEKTAKMTSVSITKPICDAIMETVCVLLLSVFLDSVSIRRTHRLAFVMVSICIAHIVTTDAFCDGTYKTSTLSRSIFSEHQTEL